MINQSELNSGSSQVQLQEHMTLGKRFPMIPYRQILNEWTPVKKEAITPIHDHDDGTSIDIIAGDNGVKKRGDPSLIDFYVDTTTNHHNGEHTTNRYVNHFGNVAESILNEIWQLAEADSRNGSHLYISSSSSSSSSTTTGSQQLLSSSHLYSCNKNGEKKSCCRPSYCCQYKTDRKSYSTDHPLLTTSSSTWRNTSNVLQPISVDISSECIAVVAKAHSHQPSIHCLVASGIVPHKLISDPSLTPAEFVSLLTTALERVGVPITNADYLTILTALTDDCSCGYRSDQTTDDLPELRRLIILANIHARRLGLIEEPACLCVFKDELMRTLPAIAARVAAEQDVKAITALLSLKQAATEGDQGIHKLVTQIKKQQQFTKQQSLCHKQRKNNKLNYSLSNRQRISLSLPRLSQQMLIRNAGVKLSNPTVVLALQKCYARQCSITNGNLDPTQAAAKYTIPIADVLHPNVAPLPVELIQANVSKGLPLIFSGSLWVPNATHQRVLRKAAGPTEEERLTDDCESCDSPSNSSKSRQSSKKTRCEKAKRTLLVNTPIATTREDLSRAFNIFEPVIPTVVCLEGTRHKRREWTATAGYAFVLFCAQDVAKLAAAAISRGEIIVRNCVVTGSWALHDSAKRIALKRSRKSDGADYRAALQK